QSLQAGRGRLQLQGTRRAQVPPPTEQEDRPQEPRRRPHRSSGTTRGRRPDPLNAMRALVAGSAAVLLGIGPTVARAQEAGAGTESTTVAAGAHYARGALHRFFFGAHYRTLWTTPIRVPILDLHQFAGGLTPLKRGGGQQTKSLRLQGANGHQYAF